MRVSFNWGIGKPVNGPGFFLNRLASELKAQNVDIVDPASSDVYFVFIADSVKKIQRLQRRGIKVIQRIDNIYFDTGNTLGDSRQLNEPLRQTYQQVDGVVFQSAYAEKMVSKRWGVKPNSIVIPNGITVDHDFDRTDRNLIVCSSSWRRHKRLKETLEVFNRLDSSYRLRIFGDPDEPVDGMDRVAFGKVPSFEAVREIYRDATVFLHLAWLDCCPNSVVEALSLGIPVVCGNQGGTRELVETTNGGFVAPTDAEFDYGDLELYNPPPINGIDEIVEYIQAKNFPEINRNPIDIKQTAKSYIEFAGLLRGQR